VVSALVAEAGFGVVHADICVDVVLQVFPSEIEGELTQNEDAEQYRDAGGEWMCVGLVNI